MKSFKSLSLVLLALASLVPYSAQAVNLTGNGIGEVAIAPYYTVRDGWQTLISVTNTQNVPVVLKVRVHESLNSRDVLDFNVALSAFDVFAGVIREAPDNSGPVFVAMDSPNAQGQVSCTIPGDIALAGNGQDEPYVNDVSNPANRNREGVALSPFAYTDGEQDGDELGSNRDGGPEGVDRLREGYVEFIVMGYTEEGTLVDAGADGVRESDGAIDVAAAIENHDCNLLDQAFSLAPSSPGSGVSHILQTARQFGEPINAIKFNFSLLNPGRGVEAGSSALAWANFYNPQPVPGGGEGPVPQHLDAAVEPGDEADCAITRGDERGRLGAPDDTAEWRPDGANSSCRNLITAQNRYAFLEPSLNDAYPAIAQWWSDTADQGFAVMPTATNGVGAPENVRGVDAVSLTIQRSAIYNEFSLNPTQGVETSWIVTLPTKNFYVDDGANGVSAGHQTAILPGQRDEVVLRDGPIGAPSTSPLPVPYAPFANEFARSDPDDPQSARACNQVNYRVFDRAAQSDQPANLTEGLDLGFPILDQAGLQAQAEQLADTLEITVEAAADLIVALLGGTGNPDPQAPDFLCQETNVITFDGANNMLSAANPINVEVDQEALSGNQSGWMFMSMNEEDAANAGGATVGGIQGRLFDDTSSFPGNGTPNLTFEGLPVIGVSMKQRTFGSVTRNFASATEHGYVRCPVPLDDGVPDPRYPAICAAD